MFIKLQPDQIAHFWELIRHGLITSYKIPNEYQHDFSLKYLESLLLGLMQAWLGFMIDEEGNKRVHVTLTTKIVDEKYYGTKCLFVDSLYTFRPITDEIVKAVENAVVPFAKANGCNMIAAEYTSNRERDYLLSNGFEYYKSVARRLL